ncbi:hypothetical protein MMC12_003338 [Toensbergia leucococca]|nr:hypothetical protein [Toensbergia leucococca]
MATTHIDRSHSTRDRPMEVLVLGLGRTGTDSIRQGLKDLGYLDTYHGYCCTAENIPEDMIMWNKAIEAKWEGKGTFGKAEFDSLLGHCMAVSDMPCAAFAPELIAAYPNAKVILTNRDVDAWYKSTLGTIQALIERKPSARRRFLSLFNQDLVFTQAVWTKMWNHYFEGDFRKNAKRIYGEHYDMVRQLVPKERLLEYRVQEGWEPLCTFLDKPIPSTPFPSGNDPGGFQKRLKGGATGQYQEMAWMAGTILGAGLLVGVVAVAIGKRTNVDFGSLISMVKG